MAQSLNIPAFKINTGASVPGIGLGVWTGVDPAEQARAKDWVLAALKAGYRHIDTAFFYGTEVAVGQAIRESGIPREEIFVTTKIPCNHAIYVERSIASSLENLGLDYVDLWLMHFPQAFSWDGRFEVPPIAEIGSFVVTDTPTYNDIWADMEKVFESGRAKAIGVSNFSLKTLPKLLETAKVVPAMNQIELHPYLTQTELIEYCKSKGIVVTAHTPTGKPTVPTDPTIVEIANKYNKSPVQVILGWHLALGVVVVPKSADTGRQRENMDLPVLSAEDVATLTSLDRNMRFGDGARADATGKVWGWTYEQLGW